MSSQLTVIPLKLKRVWIGDDDVDYCLICQDEFGWFLRRHHCRMCGGVCCHYCSQYRLPLSTYSGSYERVCDLCEKSIRIALAESKDGQIDIDLLDEQIAQTTSFLHMKVNRKKSLQTTNTTATTTQQQQQGPIVQQTTTTTATTATTTQQQQEQDETGDSSEVELERDSSTVALSTVPFGDNNNNSFGGNNNNNDDNSDSGSVVVGSTRSTCSVEAIISTGNNNTNNNNNQPFAPTSGGFDFMDDLINTPDRPVAAPKPSTPKKQPQQEQEQPEIESPSPPQSKRLSITVTVDADKDIATPLQTDKAPQHSTASSGQLINDRKLDLTKFDALSTPSSRRATNRAQYSSLKRSLTRPQQQLPGQQKTENVGLNATTAVQKLRTMKRGNMMSLIEKASLVAVAQELKSTNSVDVTGLLDTDNNHNNTDSNNNNPSVQIVDLTKEKPIYDEPAASSQQQQQQQAQPNFTIPDEQQQQQQQPAIVASAGRYTIVDLFNCLWAKTPPIIVDTRSVVHYNAYHVPFSINIPITHADIDLEKMEIITPMSTLIQRITTPSDQRSFRMRKTRPVVIVGHDLNDFTPLEESKITPEEIYAKLQQQYDIIKAADAATQEKVGNAICPTPTGATANKQELNPTLPTNDSTTSTTSTSSNSPKILDASQVVNEYETTPHITPQLFAQLLLKEATPVSAIDIVPLGVFEFCKKYPFLHCTSFKTARTLTKDNTMPERVETLCNVDKRHTHLPRFPAYPSEIIDNCLWLGSEEDAKNAQQLLKLGVTHIINATKNIPNKYEEQGTFQYLRCPMDDTHDQALLEQLQLAFTFIDDALSIPEQPTNNNNNDQEQQQTNNNNNNGELRKVLVHCQMGISRSSSIVVAYVMRSYRCTLYNALAMVKSRRQQILPNPMFLEELAKLECFIFGYDTLEQSSLKQCQQELYPTAK